MNERIEELFGQALDEVVPETWSKLTPGQVVKLSNKFAELIVKECVDTIKSNQWAKDNQAWSKGMNYSAELIKEHFGVEE